MIRYRLDDLGWCQFEWMAQALLKDRLGIGIESWGGHSDRGRDAWCDGPLHFPDKNVLTRGPFLFQAKFIEEANAAGANPAPRLLGAVRNEMKKLAKRPASDKQCAHYILLTNCVASAQNRETILNVVKASLPHSAAHVLCGNDICDLLDLSPALRRSFPQLLSLRDLDALLGELVDRKILQKSYAAILAAKDVLDVFVPTNAYACAWEVLRKCRFVVLEGPPEMGKTAIAWMLALAQIANGWEAISCDTPEDFFGAYRPNKAQIFVADDAFGRTEYDPTRGASWETQLHRVYSRLGNTHWLVWTSRKHILERARNQMDLQSAAANFPEPAEVLVDASKLTDREKALILYRHAKHSVADLLMKEFIKQNALLIVKHPAFTPERIRRFVLDALPRLYTQPVHGESERTRLIAKVQEEIRNPTERMRKSFRTLSTNHKWMLLSLLECEHNCSVDLLIGLFKKQCPNSAGETHSILDELSEAFIRIKGDESDRYVEWIHPSYRDLVVEQLRDGGSLKTEFLKGMSLQGIKLALSDTGGEGGILRFPLMRTRSDWTLLDRRCTEIIRNSNVDETAALLTILSNAIDQTTGDNEKQVLTATIETACTIARERWDATKAQLEATHILAFGQASIKASPLQPMPLLDVSWKAAQSRLERALAKEASDFLFDFSSLDRFSALCSAIKQYEPRALRQIGFPEAQAELCTRVLDRTDHELDADRSHDDADGYESEADAAFGLADSLSKLGELSGLQERVKPVVSRLVSHANRCRETYDQMKIEDGPDPDYDEYRRLSDREPEDIVSIFADL